MACTFMISRIKACDPFGSTGYPFALAINVDAGMKTRRMGSAAQRLSTPGTDGSGGVKSSAAQGIMNTVNAKREGVQTY